MNTSQSVLTGVLLSLCLLAVPPVHAAFNLSIPDIQRVAQPIKPVVSGDKVFVKKAASPIKGMTKPAGILPPLAKPVVGAGGGKHAIKVKKTTKSHLPGPGLSQRKVVTPAVGRLGGPKAQYLPQAKTLMGQKPAMGVGFAPPSAVTNRERGHGGFAPKGPVKSVGLSKPLTSAAGKGLLPPSATGTRHLLDIDHTIPGGFAAIPGVGRPNIDGPVTGSGDSSLLPAQLKLTLDHLVREDTGERIALVNQRSTVPVPLHTRMTAYLRLQNLGTEPANASVTLLANGYRPSAVISVSPGGAGALVSLPFVVDETNGDILDADQGYIFNGKFKLVTSDGTGHDFTDGNNLDNKVSVFLNVGSGRAILSISDVVVQLKAEGLSFVVNKKARERPVSEDIYVDVVVHNSGGYSSLPTTIYVTMDDIGTAIAHDSQNRVKFVKYVGHGPKRTGYVNIPMIRMNSRYIARIVFHDVSFQLWDFDRRIRERSGPFTHRTRSWHQFVSAGNYSCGFPATDDHSGHHNGWEGSQFRILATLGSQGDNTAPRPFEGKFNMGGFDNTGCGAVVSRRNR